MKFTLHAIVTVLVLGICQNSVAFTDQSIVKLSSGGICHPPESPYYSRTKHDSAKVARAITARPPVAGGAATNGVYTLKQCLGDGFRLPKILQSAYNAQIVMSSPTSTPEEKAAATLVSLDNQSELKEIDKNSQEFNGLRFGLGIGMSFLGDQIDEVRVVDGIVFVDKQRRNQGRAILESHKFIWTSGVPEPEENDPLYGLDRSKKLIGREWGLGPFVTASLTDGQGAGLLSAYGAGLMLGFRDAKSSTSWNLGIGWFVDTDVKKLRSGVVDGMQTTIENGADLTQKVDQEGLMILVSGSW